MVDDVPSNVDVEKLCKPTVIKKENEPVAFSNV